ncbi:MAG TPA: MaoC family dehydratase [Solirubrobacteraceae bacterium]|nr:MaoC family dehydratase [Solirubrobacteraceae bacterium]
MADQVVINGVDELRAKVGEEIGVSDWREVTQEDVDTFARVTGDDQWIHVDPERAKDTPFGGTIVHGYFTLALIPRFSYDLYTMTGVAFALNYGLDKVRFPAPLPTGSKVRMRLTVGGVDDIPGGAQVKMIATLEREGGDKPVCVAETLARVYTG